MADLNYIIKKSIPSFGDNENLVTSSVVCLLFIKSEIFFIHRSENMPTHKGDIAFVGGHLNSGETILDAARRELEEELSLSSDLFVFKGYLSKETTLFGKNVGVCCFEFSESKSKFLSLIKSNGEWTEAFFIEYTNFLEKENWSFSQFIYSGKVKKVYFCKIPFNKKNLWGMTASIIYKLVQSK